MNHLRAFEVAARHGSFVRAAAELHVTPAAVSHRIKELEGNVGATLFERRPRGVRLTDAGANYRQAVAGALADIDRATAALDQASIDGPLNVSISESFAQLWLAPRLSRWVSRHPGVELTIESDSRVADLHDGDVDVGVRFGIGRYPGLDSQRLMGDAATVLMSTARAQGAPDASVVALLNDAVLLEDYATRVDEPWMGWAPWLGEAGVDRSAESARRLRFSNSGFAILACAEDTGACIGRVSLVFDLLRERRLRALLPWRGTEYSYHLVTRHRDRDNPRVLAFCNWITEEANRYAHKVGRTLGLLIR